ncbi:MAG: PCMD domain-containing protein, partial [Bacteroidota bacterium]
FRTTDLVEEYTYFDLEVVYFMSEMPDTIDMVFAASAGGEYFVGGVGSTLYVDNLSLVFE